MRTVTVLISSLALTGLLSWPPRWLVIQYGLATVALPSFRGQILSLHLTLPMVCTLHFRGHGNSWILTFLVLSTFVGTYNPVYTSNFLDRSSTSTHYLSPHTSAPTHAGYSSQTTTYIEPSSHVSSSSQASSSLSHTSSQSTLVDRSSDPCPESANVNVDQMNTFFDSFESLLKPELLMFARLHGVQQATPSVTVERLRFLITEHIFTGTCLSRQHHSFQGCKSICSQYGVEGISMTTSMAPVLIYRCICFLQDPFQCLKTRYVVCLLFTKQTIYLLMVSPGFGGLWRSM